MRSDVEQLPQNIDAEQAVLGAILIKGQVFTKVSSILSRDDFHRDAHKKIFDAMVELEKDNKPIDIVTLFDFMKSKGNLLNEVGGSSYITYLTEIVPTTANVEYYAHIVRDKSIERSISERCITIDNDIKNNKIDANKALDGLQTFIDNVRNSNNSSEIISLGQQPEPPPRKWLLDSIIPMNFPTLGYGLGGTGKSYFGLYFGMQASQGNQKFLDYKFLEEPLNTLFVDYELDQEELTRRAYEIARGLGLDKPPTNIFYYSPKNDIAAFSKELRSIVRSEDIKFVIVDSLGASRLDASDEIQVIERFEELKDSGVTSFLLDHHAKMQARDSIESKTPYGSVYKYNMARSVMHLVLDKPLKNRITLRLLHTKSNFGRLQPEMLIDIVFDKDAVMVCKSNSVSQEVEQMLIIQDEMARMLKDEGCEDINQNHLIERFRGKLGRDRLITLLRRGKDSYWFVGRGKTGKSLIYIPLVDEFRDLVSKYGNPNTIYNQGFRVSDNSNDEDSLEPPPNFL